MQYTVEIIEREISHLDYLLIQHIKTLRQQNNWSQQDLSKKMGVTISFVGNVENLVERHKYSIRHLSLLKKAFKFNTISELFNFEQPTFDRIKLIIEITITIDSLNKTNRISQSKLIEIVPVQS